jgi:glycosyltransferase involved in cell wall biosynthesis
MSTVLKQAHIQNGFCMEGDNGNLNNGPLVSVLVATHNGENTIQVALDLICDSTYKNIEIIILDDASTDGTFQICEKTAKADSRVLLQRNLTNLGIVETYNKLIGLSQGKYILWNDQDDTRDVTFIEKAVLRMESEPDVALCHSYTLVTVNNVPVHSTKIDSISNRKKLIQRFWNLLRTFSDITIYGLIRRDTMLETSLWQPIPGSANVLLSELLLVGPFTQIPEILFTYQGKGLTNRPDVEQEAARAMPNQEKAYDKPWLTIARAQSGGIRRTKHLTVWQKIVLFIMLWSHILFTNSLKLTYRVFRRFLPGTTKVLFYWIFSRAVYCKRDIDYIVDPSTRPDIYPPEWPLVNAVKGH